MSTQTAYPLSWPGAWPRTKYRSTSPFFLIKRVPSAFTAGAYNNHRGQRSMADSVEDIRRETRALSASSVVISTNVELRAGRLGYGGEGGEAEGEGRRVSVGPKTFRIQELSDRYLVIDAESGEELCERFGFCYASDAREWARNQGWEEHELE